MDPALSCTYPNGLARWRMLRSGEGATLAAAKSAVMPTATHHKRLLAHVARATPLALMLTGCAYTPEQIACRHARDRAEHHGVVAGVGVAVVVVLLAVTVCLRRHPTPMPTTRRALMAAVLTMAAAVPVAVLFAILGSSWTGRTYHCGDGEDLPFGLLLMLAVVPAAIALPATAGLLLWARRVWHGAKAAGSRSG